MLQSENPLKKGSNVYVRLFPPMGTGEGPCWVKGTVVDICEDSFKFHVKPIKVCICVIFIFDNTTI